MLDRFLLISLFDIYEKLLTDNQRDVFTLYFIQDNSLGEIAAYTGITRQAVHDLLKRTEKILLKYESMLKYGFRNMCLQKTIEKIESLAQEKYIDPHVLAEIADSVRNSINLSDEQECC